MCVRVRAVERVWRFAVLLKIVDISLAEWARAVQWLPLGAHTTQTAQTRTGSRALLARCLRRICELVVRRVRALNANLIKRTTAINRFIYINILSDY